MADSDHPMDYVSPSEEPYTSYPDIDESVQYPWRENDALAAQGNPADPVIDPRLFQDLFAQNSPQRPVHEAGDVSDGSLASLQQDYADFLDDDESDFQLSEEGSARYGSMTALYGTFSN